ncbi:MAG: UDP-N-acetylmuramoyl-L-alanyl-D-glutamate--2,6-diaminopimelate ligase [Actinobacteria bacterium]|nr:UDP-N-acetylmuramoyl-L-alanyl-D-glutamate--2,6-diaminopimelate ligase [Actinomycetota bacterium]
MKIAELIKGLKLKEISGYVDLEIRDISIDSRKVSRDCLFVAIPGFKYDGHGFVEEAIKKGAICVVTQKKMKLPQGVTQIIVENSREALPIICRNFFGDPSRYLRLIGVTGTNGKTTTCFLIDSIMRFSGFKTSLITTVSSFIGKRPVAFDRTTPDALDLNRFLKESIKEGIEIVCMEVSSHSIDLHRVDFLDFDFFVFTNLSQDHLDYHKSMDSYFETKKKLFLKEYRELYGGRKAIINIDDSYGEKIAEVTDLDKILYSIIDPGVDIFATNIRNKISGMEMDVYLSGYGKLRIFSPLCGYFNVYNILASIGVSVSLGVDLDCVAEGIRAMEGVKGRLERIKLDGGITAVVDYAHTPDGLRKVLETLKSTIEPGGRIICVFGCGGDRDRGKREIMGSISATLADFTIITSDNPRSEDPESIMEMIEKGVIETKSKNYIKEPDREKAIITALDMAKKGDIVLIAGKGHEDYQEFKDFRIPFSDQEIVKKWAGQSG